MIILTQFRLMFVSLYVFQSRLLPTHRHMKKVLYQSQQYTEHGHPLFKISAKVNKNVI